MKNNESNRPERRKVRTPGIRINRICLFAVALLFFAVAALNLFQFNRPTVSEAEKRPLAAWPEFSWKSLGDGSYFSGISDFLKDTFWQRDALIGISGKLDPLKGYDLTVDGVRYVVIDNSANETDPAAEETTIDLSFLDDITEPEETEPPEITAAPDATAAPDVTTSPDVTSSPAETGTPESSGSAPETAAPPETSQTPPETLPFAYLSLSLSAGSFEMTEGEAYLLKANLYTQGSGTPEKIQWTASDPNTVLLHPADDGLSVTVMGLLPGTVTVTAQAGPLSTPCTVRVAKKQSGTQEPEVREIDGSVFMYGDAFYQGVNYGGASLASIAQGYATLCKKYAAVFRGNPQVSFLPAPHAVIMLDTAKVKKAGRDQGLILQEMQTYYPDSVRFINVYDTMKAHTNEYLYFKTDHHWTALGAYYAYVGFANAMGFTPTPLSAMRKVTNTTSYAGSYKSYFQDNHIEGLYDTVDMYYPTKAHTCTVYYSAADAKTMGASVTYNSSLFSGFKSYLCFLSGDRPMVEITVPENGGSEGRTVLVLHDSYGSAMIPYLAEHYGKIIAVDPREFIKLYKQPIQDVLGTYTFDDILFLQNIQMANSSNWLQNMWAKLIVQR